MVRAVFLRSGSQSCDVKIIYDEIPINKNRIVHTMGKSHDGGVSGGFAALSKLLIPNADTIPDKAPIPRLIAQLIPSFL